jgi:Ca-activated chloride channel family protein
MNRTIPSRRAVIFFLVRWACLSLLAIGSTTLCFAQDDPDPRVSTNLVVVPFEVTDQHHRRVPGLKSDDFLLTDNGQTVRPEFFAAGAERTAIIFLWDQSDSVRDVVAGQQAAALSLLDRFGPQAKVALMRFGVRPQMVTPFTADRDLLRKEFGRTPPPDNRTAIFDAALVAVTAFAARPRDLAERRIVILLSDGLDNASSIKARQVIDAARSAAVSFYLIYTPLYTARDNALVPRSPSGGFRDLALKTGGQISATPTGKAATAAALAGSVAIDLGSLLQAIADDLNGQYLLAYYLTPEAATVGVHRPGVQLNSSARKNLTVRILRGDLMLEGPQEAGR